MRFRALFPQLFRYLDFHQIHDTGLAHQGLEGHLSLTAVGRSLAGSAVPCGSGYRGGSNG